MAKQQIYEYQTKNGVMKWQKQLKPRTNSGYIGQITVNIQITDDEFALIQKKNPEITSKTLAEIDYLSKHGIVREIKQTATADKTPVPADNTAKWIFEQLKAGLTEDAIKLMLTGNGWTNEQILVYFPAKTTKSTVPPPPQFKL